MAVTAFSFEKMEVAILEFIAHRKQHQHEGVRQNSDYDVHGRDELAGVQRADVRESRGIGDGKEGEGGRKDDKADQAVIEEPIHEMAKDFAGHGFTFLGKSV